MSKGKMVGIFLLGGIIGYAIGAPTFGIMDHRGRTDTVGETSVICLSLTYGWMIWPLSLGAFVSGGMVALVLLALYPRIKSRVVSWLVALGLGTLGGLGTGIFFYFVYDKRNDHLRLFRWDLPELLLYSGVAGLASGAVIGLVILILERKATSGKGR